MRLSKFLTALQKIDASGGPPPGLHNFHRGGSVSIYGEQTLHAIQALKDTIGKSRNRDLGSGREDDVEPPAGLDPWRRSSDESVSTRRAFKRGHRFRLYGRRRSGMRSNDCVDVVFGGKPGCIPGGHQGRRGYMVPRARLGIVESADHPRRRLNRQSRQNGRGSADAERTSFRSAVRLGGTR